VGGRRRYLSALYGWGMIGGVRLQRRGRYYLVSRDWFVLFACLMATETSIDCLNPRWG
jgi:hypothetical protein